MLKAPAPDPGWLPVLKIFFGFLMLLTLAILAGLIALGKVTQEHSYGLDIILGGLLTLAGGFSQWAFGAIQQTADKTNENSKRVGEVAKDV